MADEIDLAPYVEPKLVEFAPSTTTTPMVTRSGPWYTYTRAATAKELATGISEFTPYDASILARYGGSYDNFHVSERERLLKKGLDIA